MSFVLNPRLEADTVPVKRLTLSRLLLMNDAAWPWLILVPEVADIKEIHELDASQRAQLMEEIAMVSERLAQLFAPDKINVAALGNMVPQLHVHVIARFKDDPAWPKPVWGQQPPTPYTPQALVTRLKQLHDLFDR